MDKVLVEVICPATAKSYDFWIAKQAVVKNVARRIAEDIMLFEMNMELFDLEKDLYFFFYENRELMNEVYTIQQSGIKSGCKLLIL